MSLIPCAWLLSPYSLVTFEEVNSSPLLLLRPVTELTQLIAELLIEDPLLTDSLSPKINVIIKAYNFTHQCYQSRGCESGVKSPFVIGTSLGS